MTERMLRDVILAGLIERRLPAWSERLGHYARAALQDRGGTASEEQITSLALDRMRTEEPALFSAYQALSTEALVVEYAIEHGYTVDADGIVRPPA